MSTTLGALLQTPVPHLPHRGRLAVACQLGMSAVLHLAAAIAIAAASRQTPAASAAAAIAARQAVPFEITHLVFMARDDRLSGGGGGGGNREPGPIRRAEGVGRDRATLHVVKPEPAARTLVESSPSVAALPGVLLDATPLASGARDVIGLPDGGVAFGTSTGPGSGGGVGEGVGTGIGSGNGPGLGPGSGGGTGGGVYRPGGSVTTPRVLRQVKPKYTVEALYHKIQGSVVLELVVKSDGRTGDIRVIQSLDPGGLDDQAVAAARQWEFEPGRLAGTPVAVLVTLMLDFRIQ